MIIKKVLDKWGKGFINLVGVEIESVSEDEAVGTLLIQKKHLNPHGTVHGGVIYTLIDSTAGALVIYGGEIQRKAVTLSSSVSYLRAFTDGTMRAVAKAKKNGRNVANVTVEVFDDENNLCATGLFDFFYIE